LNVFRSQDNLDEGAADRQWHGLHHGGRRGQGQTKAQAWSTLPADLAELSSSNKGSSSSANAQAVRSSTSSVADEETHQLDSSSADRPANLEEIRSAYCKSHLYRETYARPKCPAYLRSNSMAHRRSQCPAIVRS
jgi:hypothetical protein